MQVGGDPAGAVEQYRRALELDPLDVQAHYNLGTALADLGRSDEALARYREAVRLQPSHAQAQHNLGAALANRGRLDEAIEHFRRAAALAPDRAITQHQLGRALGLAGRDAEALPALREAVRLAPGLAEPASDLAWLLATSPDDALRDPEQALRLARRAAELGRGDDPLLFDTLAAALAAAGRFDEAAASASRAVELAGSRDVDVAAIQRRLERYRRGEPYRRTQRLSDR
jgi:spermidine synthase